MKTKTSDLTLLALDWAVVRCECDIPAQFKSIPALLNGTVRVFRKDAGCSEPVSPSTNWAHGGPIIEREEICVLAPVRGLWRGRKEGRTQYGPTPLIAAMRCYVASKMGDEVEIPQELVE